MISLKIVCGSGRPNGNTSQIARVIAEFTERQNVETEIIDLHRHHIEPCHKCGSCNTRRTPCAIEDDVLGIVSHLTAADAIIYGAPVHAFGTSEVMQRFLERAGVGHLRFQRPLANKVASVYVTGRRYGHLVVHNQIVNNFLLNRMIVVGSGFPVILRGGAPGNFQEDNEGMQALKSMVRRVIAVALAFRNSNIEFDSTVANILPTNERLQLPVPAAQEE